MQVQLAEGTGRPCIVNTQGEKRGEKRAVYLWIWDLPEAWA